MPVITRSQKVTPTFVVEAKVSTKKKVVKRINNIREIINERKFVEKIKPLLESVNQESFATLNDKIILSTIIYGTINQYFPDIYEANKLKWINFMALVFNKTIELEQQIKEQPHYKFDEVTLENFNRELNKARKITVQILSGDTSFTTDQTVLLAKQKILNMSNQRSRRNLKRINYSGLDMNEDDQGSIYLCEPRFKRTENGVNVRYYWSKLALSNVNEIGDEDYSSNEEHYENQEDKQEEVQQKPKRQSLKRQEQFIKLRRSPRNLKRID